jgi:SAM-dependent methyltransferase
VTTDFGYSWPWTHGHLVASLVLAALSFLLRRRSSIFSAILTACSLWALAAFLIVTFVFGYNRVQQLPSTSFLKQKRGPARILDIGSGSGRATIAVALANPESSVVALDNFSAPYITDHGPARLTRNLQAAGVAKRVRVLTADMRQIPEENDSFDAVISTYAIDHVNREGIRKTIAEVRRILKPQGEFLLMVLNNDAWMRFVFPPVAIHGLHGRKLAWDALLEEHGLRVVESGRSPASMHFYSIKR